LIFATILILATSSQPYQVYLPLITVPPHSFTFASMGDAQEVPASFSLTANQVASLNPDLVIFNGDLENKGVTKTEMAPMVSVLNSSGIYGKTFAIRGNHDNLVTGSSTLWQTYFPLQYSHIYENSIFIGLDVPGNVQLLTSDELNYLDGQLTYAENLHLVHAFISWHGPVYCVESQHCTCRTRTDASCTPSALVTLLNKHPIVSAMFFGHEHILGWVHMDKTRLAGLTGNFEEFFTSAASAGYSYYQYLFPSRIDYAYNVGSGAGFETVIVNGNSFTVSLYKVGVIAPVWTKSFTK
jgi:hypothetical protein